MYSKGHLHINKYFAFVFMVVAVMSGVADAYAETSILAMQGNESTYFLKINQRFSKDISKIRGKGQVERKNAFSMYIHHIADVSDMVNYTSISFAFGALGIAVFLISNRIIQNNIWRATVF